MPVPIILGIDPGARQIGVSVLRGEEIVFYAVKTFKKRNPEDSLKKLRMVIGKLITEYEIEFVAVEKIVFVQQHRSFVKVAYEEIKNFAKKQNVEFFEYNPKLIRQKICRIEKATRHNTTLILAHAYPELARYFNVPKLWQKIYYSQLFGAIATGIVCAKELEKTKS